MAVAEPTDGGKNIFTEWGAKLMKSYLLAAKALFLLVLVLAVPTFAADEGPVHEHRTDGAFSPLRLVKPLGICALSLLVLTGLSGVFRRKLGRRFIRVHSILAVLTLLVAVCHGTLVLVLF